MYGQCTNFQFWVHRLMMQLLILAVNLQAEFFRAIQPLNQNWEPMTWVPIGAHKYDVSSKMLKSMVGKF